ncbi:EAL domain-containing protein [Gordonibacter sp. KGMB07426]|uniref:EAL domain-containing protein n=1 Tax=Gordonibacter sp. KGMB07426 TaxID=3404046 RepID=UPI003B28D363
MRPVWQTGGAEGSTSKKADGGGGRSRHSFGQDSLTGLLSRSGFNSRVRALISENPGESFVIVYGDIDRFKVYNDLFGTHAGDQLLAAIGAMLRDLLPPNTAVARLRADHFVCCCPHSLLYPDRLLSLLDDWFANYREDFTFFVRLGIYVIDEPELDVSLMCDRALLALKAAKDGHAGSKYALYDETLRASVLKEQQLAGEMVKALEEGQFVPYFQPQYRYAAGRMTGAEVLARWNHPERGLVSPAEFIPVLERNGLIARLDYYLWEQACSCLRDWIDRLGADRVPRLSVNLSRADIYRADLCSYLNDLLRRYNLPTDLLHLEITETAYMEAPEQLVDAVTKLRAAGFVVEMDDFGSGYSSLNTLKDVPVDALKIDMGFLDARDRTRGGIILASVVRMARLLDLPATAEGVETQEQAVYLASIGCEYMQGYLFSKPLDRASFERLLTEQPSAGEEPPISEDAREDAIQQRLYDAIPCGIVRYTADDIPRMLFMNRKACQILGYRDLVEYREVTGGDAFAPILPDDLTVQQSYFETLREGEPPCDFALRYQRRDGFVGWIEGTSAFEVNEEGCPLVQSAFMEVTQQRLDRAESAWQNERYRLLSEMTNTISFDYDSESDTVLLYIDRTGKGMEAQVISHYLETLESTRKSVLHPDSVADVRAMFERARAGAQEVGTEYRADYYGGGYAWYRTKLYVVHDQNGAWHLVGIIEDIEDERALRFRAEFDAVTGLTNHAATQELVSAALANPDVRANSVCVVLDIDDFKLVNDTCGHIEGDALLHAVGMVLRTNFREGDVVGRVGGDEFVLLLKNIDPEVALRKLQRVRTQIAAVPVVGRSTGASISAGVYLTCDDDRSYRDVFVKADEALYQAKRAGKDRIQMYQEG